jgi:hypothetical protein
MDLLRGRSETQHVNSFLRILANGFKASLRPTDATAWLGEADAFLAMIEDVPTPEACLTIVDRVQTGMNGHLSRHPDQSILHCVSGMLICDIRYKDVEGVMSDLASKRSSLRSGEIPAPAVFDHNTVLTQK